MKFALSAWDGRVAPVLDETACLQVFSLEHGELVKHEPLNLIAIEPFARAREIASSGARTIICGAVSRSLEKALLSSGIQVIGFVRGQTDCVIQAFIQHRLRCRCYRMPGKPGGRRCRWRGGRDR